MRSEAARVRGDENTILIFEILQRELEGVLNPGTFNSPEHP